MGAWFRRGPAAPEPESDGRPAARADRSRARAARVVAELHEPSAEFVRARERHEVAEHFEDRRNLVSRFDVEILLVTTARTTTEGRGKRQPPSDSRNRQPAR
ncbi:hypothetical protein ADL25_17135 [Streptomyces sp. NRRL F-5122]|uniref:hypothetical protein n=1 Tax=unclassified Streptomyces TaxID=2593676 RepID=UPI0007411DCB|nr:hypothetical protein [Streptomyces sp. NRRL F-5122]KUJ41154.1 hypothetical protein ADL25_17135 [Streptomyces sp. NRRL F-5122]